MSRTLGIVRLLPDGVQVLRPSATNVLKKTTEKQTMSPAESNLWIEQMFITDEWVTAGVRAIAPSSVCRGNRANCISNLETVTND